MTFKYRYRKQILIISLIVILLGSSIFSYYYFFPKEKKDTKSKLLLSSVKKEDKEVKKNKKEEEITEIMIDIKGEVINSGIYRLKNGSRVIDAIEMAGGITNNADTSVLNLSKKLSDEMVIIVYSYYEVSNFSKTKEIEEMTLENCVTGSDGLENSACIESDTTSNLDNKISINNATIDEFLTLDGVGETKAKSIIEYREKNGLFKAIEEIKNVSGIGDSLFDKIKENITL